MTTPNLARALALGTALGSATPVHADFGYSGGVSIVVWFGGGEASGGLTFDVRGAGLIEGSSSTCDTAPRAGLGVFQ